MITATDFIRCRRRHRLRSFLHAAQRVRRIHSADDSTVAPPESRSSGTAEGIKGVATANPGASTETTQSNSESLFADFGHRISGREAGLEGIETNRVRAGRKAFNLISAVRV